MESTAANPEQLPPLEEQVAHIEHEEVRAVTAAYKPVLTLPDGTEVSLPKIPAIRVIEMMEDAAMVDDKEVDLNDRLQAHARLMRTFGEVIKDDRIMELDVEDFGVVFRDFFVHMQRKMAGIGGPKTPHENRPARSST